ncbi:MAG: response regulator [Deltaproteobacteria bacterium]|nr:response regulator [Deltaproteobacteria bacterium]
MNRVLIRDTLTINGFTVWEVDTGLKAVEWVKANPPPNLILMDLSLPEMDGVTAMKHIRAYPPTSNVPIIAITASAMRGDEEKALAEGFDGYIAKPVNIEELVRVVKKYPVSP